MLALWRPAPRGGSSPIAITVMNMRLQTTSVRMSSALCVSIRVLPSVELIQGSGPGEVSSGSICMIPNVAIATCAAEPRSRGNLEYHCEPCMPNHSEDVDIPLTAYVGTLYGHHLFITGPKVLGDPAPHRRATSLGTATYSTIQ